MRREAGGQTVTAEAGTRSTERVFILGDEAFFPRRGRRSSRKTVVKPELKEETGA